MSLSTVVLASNNVGKLAEFSSILDAAGIKMVAQSTLGVSEAEEPYLTFIENALAKARHASRSTGLPALADDSGLCVPALNNAPGVLSARYAALSGGEKSDAANNQHLLASLAHSTDRSAYYVAVLVYLRFADDPCPIIAQGYWHGQISSQPAGQFGFGYDPYFYLPDLGLTAAELTPTLKNQYSHRGQALRELLTLLQSTTQ